MLDNVEQYNNTFAGKSKLELFHTNIRSIAKNFDELRVFLDQFVRVFDVIILTETFRIEDLQPYRLPGYSVVYNYGCVNKNDGVIVYVRAGIRYDYEIIPFDNIQVVQISFTLDGEKYYITCIYRLHPTCPFKFNRHIHQYLNQLHHLNPHYSIIIGDININILDKKDFTQQYLNIMSERGYVSQVNKYTRVDGQKKSCIDHIFTRSRFNSSVFLPIILREQITDHYPLIFGVCVPRSINNQNRKLKMKYFINYNSLKQAVNNETWYEIYQNSEDLDYITELFVSKLQYLIREHTHCMRVRRGEVHRKEWVTDGLVKSMRTKNSLYKRTLSDPNNSELKKEYIQYKSKLTKLIKVAKILYYNAQISKPGNTTKNLYNVVNQIISTKNIKRSETIEKAQLPDGSLTCDKKEIAEYFCSHYSTYGDQLASAIERTPREIHTHPLSQTFFIHPATESEIENIISELKVNTGPGYDGIKSETLKELKSYITKPLVFLVNNIIEKGEWPSAFKLGVIKPIYKNGNKTNVVNYRPITLISNIAKIAEKFIKARITNFIEKHHLLSDSQFGFREGRSTEDALARLTGMVYNSLDNSEASLCIFVDLSKAFDTVDHSILLDKLNVLGFRGRAHDLLRSYVSDRFQRVQVADVFSEPRPVTCGVPQGTVLGPILFLLFMNDLLAVDAGGQILSYADDTAVFYSSDSREALQRKAEIGFRKVNCWFRSNRLTVNSEKTKFLVFSLKRHNHACSTLNIGDTDPMEIEPVDSIKYLGVTIDCHLRWNLHINRVIKNVRSFIFKFKELSRVLNPEKLKILYHSFVASQLSYGIVAWGGACNSYVRGLEVIQKWILKIIFKKPRAYPTDDLFRDAAVLDIRQQFILAVASHMRRRAIAVQYPEHRYETRNKALVCKKRRCKKSIGQKSFTYVGRKIADLLPEPIKKVVNFQKYKREVRQWLLNNPRKKIFNLINNK